MFLCFESDGKRSAFPESSLLGMDENGFTMHASTNSRTGTSTIFFRMDAFQGASANFKQTLAWVRRMSSSAKG